MEARKREKRDLVDCNALRLLWRRSRPYWEAMHRAKIATNQYKCETCEKIFKIREVQVDHTFPVVDPETGWVDLATFAQRLFCSSDKLTVMCQDVCHKKKSYAENKIRRK